MLSSRSALILCYAAMATIAAAVNLLPVFLTRLSVDLGGLDAEQLGRIGAVTIGGLVTGILVSGPLADRLGARMFAVGGNALAAIGLAWLALAPGYAAVLGASALLGIGAGVLDMVLSPIVAALQPDRRQAAMNLLHSFFCSGAMVIIGLASLAIYLEVSWRLLAAWVAVWPVMVGLGFARAALPSLVAEGDVRIPLRRLMSERQFLLSLVAILLGGSTEVGMAFWLPAYAERTLGYSPTAAGLGLMGFTLAMTVGRLGIVALPRSLGPVKLMLWCCALSVVLFAVASFSRHAGIALAACVLAGLTGSCLWPSVLAVTADRFPAGGATMFALLAATGNAGAMFMPWLIGGVADGYGMRVALATAGLCPLIMIGVLLAMPRQLIMALPTPAV